MPGQALTAGEDQRLGFEMKILAGASVGVPGNAGADGMLRFIHGPESGELAGEGSAERFEHAGEPFVHGGGFANDLADDELDAQAALAAVLLRNVAEDAAHRNRSGLLTAAAEAGFHFDVLAGGVLQPQRMVFHAHAVQRLVEQSRGFGLHFRREGGLEADERLELRGIHAEQRLPRRVHVEIAAARTERGNHLRGVVEQIAVALLALPQRVFGASRRAQVDGNRNQTFDGSGRGTHRGEINHGGKGAAVSAPVAHLESAHPAGRETWQRSGHKAAAWAAVFGGTSGWVRKAGMEAASCSPTRAISLSGKRSARGEFAQRFVGAIAEHAFGGGIEEVDVTGEIAGDHHRTGGIEDAAVQARDALQLALRPGVHGARRESWTGRCDTRSA